MLDKKEILQKLKELKLPSDQYCVMTGAALVLHGVKAATRDIDIGCTDQLFEELLSRGYKQQSFNLHDGIVIDGTIEIFRNWHAEKTAYIEGIPVADIYAIRDYKVKLGREKDLKDIMLIDEYLAARTH